MNVAVSDKQRDHRFLSSRAAGFCPRECIVSLAQPRIVSHHSHKTRAVSRSALALMLPMLSAIFAVGCAKPPATTPEDVVDYVRNAVVGAEARRLDDEHQKHVTSVLASYRAWQDECASVQELCESESLWSMESAKWRDTEAVDERLEALKHWTDAATQADAESKSATQLREDVSAAITRTPYSSDIRANMTEHLELENEPPLCPSFLRQW